MMALLESMAIAEVPMEYTHHEVVQSKLRVGELEAANRYSMREAGQHSGC